MKPALRTLKWLSVSLLALTLIAALLSHGVVLPRFVWEPRLVQIQNQYPDHRIEVKRVVVALSHRPELILSELRVEHVPKDEQLELGLLRLRINLADSIRDGRLQVDGVTIKGLLANARKTSDCSRPNSECITVLPLAVVARAWASTQVANPGFFTPQLSLKELKIEQAEFRAQNPQAKQTLSGQIEQLHLELGDTEEHSLFNAGWRLRHEGPGTDEQIYLSLYGKPRQHAHRELTFKNLTIDMDGRWLGFPWTGTAQADLIALRIRQALEGSGAPVLKFNGDRLRTYLRRDDLPETHQAAFSVQRFEGGLPAQDWALNKAEWTFTHEDAQAWTFNMNYDAGTAALNITPETIAGSEGLPAEAHTRTTRCDLDTDKADVSRPYWVWQEGWFRILNKAAYRGDGFALCPIQDSLEGGNSPAPSTGK